MTAFRKPMVRVKVQRRKSLRKVEGVSSASVFTYRPSSKDAGLRIDVDVSQASSRDGAVKNLVVDVTNAPRKEVLTFQSNGIVEVEAGYEEIIGAKGHIPTPRTIFRGTLDFAANARRGPSNVLHIEASSSSSRADDQYVHVSTKPGVALSIGEAIQRLARAIGGDAYLPDSAFGTDASFIGGLGRTDLVGYTSIYPVRQEIERLVEDLTYATRVQHLLVYSDEAPFTFIVINTRDPRIPLLAVNILGPGVSNATPIVLRGEPTSDFAIGDEVTSGPDKLEESVSSLGYSIDGAFDPRYVLGLRVRPDGEEPPGLMLITSVHHTLGRSSFRSSISGPFSNRGG